MRKMSNYRSETEWKKSMKDVQDRVDIINAQIDEFHNQIIMLQNEKQRLHISTASDI